MFDNIIDSSLKEIIKGYSYDSQQKKYICRLCAKEFEEGEIFKVDERYFVAAKMVERHIQEAHGDMFSLLISYDKKYTGLTENQKNLLTMMHQGMSDNEISKETGLAPATIRHQRFVFREKAKQAKLYLSIYELAIKGGDSRSLQHTTKDQLLEIHKNATMVDDRYFATKSEEEKTLQNMFISLSPLRLKSFATKEKKKIIILRRISEEFERDKKYNEAEVNAVLKEIYEDYATLRRYMIEYGFMDRTNDCKEYWLK